MHENPLQYQTFFLEREDGQWTATQRDVDFVGQGANPARAVEDYAAQIAEEVYEGDVNG